MDWTHRLLDTVTYRLKASFSDGDFTYGAKATCKARVQQENRIVPGTGGQELTSTHKMWVRTDIPEGARVWLPDGDSDAVGEAYNVIHRKEAYTLIGGYTGYVLYLGR